VRIESADCVLSALKRSNDGAGLVLRFYSVSDDAQDATVRLWRSFARIARTRLDETGEETLTTTADEATLTVRPHEIVTLKLTP
jgi:alpha-mannosidase